VPNALVNVVWIHYYVIMETTLTQLEFLVEHQQSFCKSLDILLRQWSSKQSSNQRSMLLG
jgi:hypothetical protein